MAEITKHEDTAPEAVEEQRRIPALAEALGYAGGGLALAALVALVATFWEALGVYGRVGIGVLVAVAGLVGGLMVERLREPAARRLSQFLLFIGVAGIGVAVGFAVRDLALNLLSPPMPVAAARADAAEWAWFAAFFSAAIAGGIVWFTRRTWLQHLAFGLGVGVSSLLVLPLIPTEGPDWGPGLVLAGVGLVWGALSWRGWLEPTNAGLALGTLGITGGIQMMALSTADDGGLLPWAVWLGLGASVALVALGAWAKRYVVVGIGAASVVACAIELVVDVFDIGMATPLAFLGVSVLLLGGTAYAMRRPAAAEAGGLRIATEIAGYAGFAFAVAGVLTLLIQYFDVIGVAGRIAVPLGVAAVVFSTAFAVEHAETDSARRLSQTLFAGGTLAVGVAGAMAGYNIMRSIIEPLGPNENYVPYRDIGAWGGLFGSTVAFIVGLVVWRFRKGVMTMIVPGVASFVVVTTALGMIPYESRPYWTQGAVLLAVGLAWAVLGFLDLMKPGNAALSIGSAITIVGVLSLNDRVGDMPVWPSVLGLVLAGAAIGISIWRKRGVLLGFGAVGVVLFAFMGVQAAFEGEIAGVIALLVAGIAFIGMAVLVVFMMPRFRQGRPHRGRHLRAV